MITYQNSIFLLYCLFFVITVGFSQEKQVRLIEEVQKKRTLLYIQNNTDTEKSVFLHITPKGYRRSAQRPVLKMISAKSKVHVTTLIPLKDSISSYTYTLIVNKELKNINGRREKQNVSF